MPTTTFEPKPILVKEDSRQSTEKDSSDTSSREKIDGTRRILPKNFRRDRGMAKQLVSIKRKEVSKKPKVAEQEQSTKRPREKRNEVAYEL